MDGGVGLHALQHVEAAAAALALGGVGGVGHHLQLAQHELGHDDVAVDEARLGDVGNAAVDDDAGVQHLGAAAGWPVAGEDIAQRRGVEQIALVGAHQQAHIGHEHQHEDLQHRRGGTGQRRGAKHEAEQRRAEDAQDAARHGANQTPQGECSYTQLEDNYGAGCQRAHGCRQPSRMNSKGMKNVANRGEQKYKKNTNQDDIHTSQLSLGQ